MQTSILVAPKNKMHIPRSIYYFIHLAAPHVHFSHQQTIVVNKKKRASAIIPWFSRGETSD